jgi:imidazolonepropionase-like amidohydrolase
MFVIAALAPPAAYVRDGNSSLLADPRLSAMLTDGVREQLGRPLPGPASLRDIQAPARLRLQAEAVRSIHDAGATLLVGTDATRDLPVAFGISLHRELELLKDAGLRPVEALAAATANTATAFRLQDRGRIVAGRRADMLLVRGNSTVDILANRDILRVWKRGIEVDLR